MRIAVIALAAVLALAGQAVADHDGPVAIPKDFNTLIVEGKRVGNLRIGMSLSDAAIVLRRVTPDLIDVPYGDKGRMICAKTSPNLCVSDGWTYGDEEEKTYTPGRVIRINTEYVQLKTRDGLGAGSKLSLFVRKYGKPSFEENAVMEWWRRGIAVAYGPNSIYEVFVVKPRR